MERIAALAALYTSAFSPPWNRILRAVSDCGDDSLQTPSGFFHCFRDLLQIFDLSCIRLDDIKDMRIAGIYFGRGFRVVIRNDQIRAFFKEPFGDSPPDPVSCACNDAQFIFK